MKDKWINILQWFPILGVPIAFYCAITNKPYSIILRPEFFLISAVWHAITFAAVFIYLGK